MTLSQAALQFATEAHKGQTRWNKTPYINHPIAVAESIPNLLATTFAFKLRFDENEVEMLEALGCIHDVPEDCKPYQNKEELVLDNVFNLADLDPLDPRNGYSRMLPALINLNKAYHRNYRDFVLACKGNIFSHVVKYADLKHNSSDLTKGSMLDKYLLAIYILEQ